MEGNIVLLYISHTNIHEQDKLMDSICKSLERIADIFSFDVDNKYRKALEDLLVYLFDDTSTL